MKLRTHMHLIVASLCVACLLLVVYAEVDATRRAVHEEIVAANAVASKLLSDVIQHYADDRERLLPFLSGLGRVRAQEITAYAADGSLLYRSTPSTYKSGRSAPRWFERLLLPSTPHREYQLSDGTRVAITANASRAILDGWDDIIQVLIVAGLAIAALNIFVFFLVDRVLAPFPVIVSGLQRLQQGDLRYRLPPLAGAEASAIACAFNSMASAVEDKVAAERKARDAEARLEQRRELACLIEQRIEEERRTIARELHDEFAQSVTAIRSLALAIMQSRQVDASQLNAAQLIASEALRLYDAMHGLIPRLTPLALDTLGLAATLRSFIEDWQKRHPAIQFSIRQTLPDSLGPTAALSIYRVVQEGIINAIRHGKPTHVHVEIETEHGVRVTVSDDGVGLPTDWQRPGRLGLYGLAERVKNLQGTLSVRNRPSGGVELCAEFALGMASAAA